MLEGFIVIMVFAVIFGGAWIFDKSRSASSGSATPVPDTTKDLSMVAKQVYHEYMSLPEDSRPVPDIVSVLRGLDAATAADADGERERRDHFDWNSYMRKTYGSVWGPVKFTWDGPAYGRRCSHNHHCKYEAYFALHKQIAKVKEEVQKKNEALSFSQNAHHVDMAMEVVERLRDEADIQRSVRGKIAGTQEFSTYLESLALGDDAGDGFTSMATTR